MLPLLGCRGSIDKAANTMSSPEKGRGRINGGMNGLSLMPARPINGAPESPCPSGPQPSVLDPGLDQWHESGGPQILGLGTGFGASDADQVLIPLVEADGQHHDAALG